MDDFEKLLRIVDSGEVKEGISLPKIQLHKWLVLGQSNYLCENGTLSDGHEKFTPAQKYAQSFKEYYNLATSIENIKAAGMESQANLIEAEEELSKAKTEIEKLRAMAKLTRAKVGIIQALASAEDQFRMITFYRNKIDSLKAEVESKYPEGLEQAELDNWKAVANYRMVKSETPGHLTERLDNIPLPAVVKAQLGAYYNRPDAYAPLMVINKDLLHGSDSADLTKFITRVQESQQPKPIEELK